MKISPANSRISELAVLPLEEKKLDFKLLRDETLKLAKLTYIREV